MHDRCSLQFLLAIVIAMVCALPALADVESVDGVQDVEGTVRGAMRMTLLDATTTLTDSPTNDIHVSLGDTIAIDVWLQNPTQEEITSISTYFTVNGDYFRPVPLATYSTGDIQVFENGYFMAPAQASSLTPIGNYTHGDKTGPDQNGLPGWQLDYFTFASAPPLGGEQKYSNYPEGVACTFYLIATAVCDSATIMLDYTPGNQRFSRYGIRGSNDTFTFRTYQTCYITVSGLKIEPPLPDLFMEPGTSDSTSLDLDAHVNSGAIPDSLFDWSATGNHNIGVTINPSTHQVTFTAPAGFRGSENITFTLYNDSDPELDTDTMRVTVGYRPHLLKEAIPDTITIYEDSTHVAVLYLPDTVVDIDNAFDTLVWQFTTKNGNVIPTRQNTVLNLRGVENFFGTDSLYISVTDDMQLADRDTVVVRVLPVNDAPVVAGIPDGEFERTESHDFDLSQYAYDVDNDPLQVSWGSPAHFFVEAVGMNITITEVEGYLGSEDLVFTVRDPSGLADSDTMRVTVTPKSLAPVWQPIPKLGFAQDGMFSDLVIWDYVNDPDGLDQELTFTFSGNDDVDSIYVDPANGRLYMWDLDDTPGWDWVWVTAKDFDNNTASTRFLVFVAPKDGTPIVGAIPDTTMRAGLPLGWIDLDNYYYDIDNTDGQMHWTWEHLDPDSLVYADIHNLFRTVTLYTYNPDSTGIDNLRFIVTDPTSKSASDDCAITVLGETRPLLDMPSKIGFVTGERELIDLDDYTEDPDFPKSSLTWQWWGNSNIEMGYSTNPADTLLSRPFYFTSDGAWVGWEKTFFQVRNPLGGASTDSTIVFSVPGDGTPVAGGLEYVYVRAGYCDSMSIDLDNFYYDDDTLDWGVSWTITGNDSVLISIDPVSHRAQFCSPSETFEGQEIVTLTVSDGIHSDSMEVAVIVYGAVYRNVFTLNVFRNPMQTDYMDFYLECSKELFNVPAVEVRVENTEGGDTTSVSMSALGSGVMYYHGRYLLPYASSLGLERTAEVIATAQTKNGKAVEDTLAFSYGRLGAGGGKLAVGPVSLDVPAGAITVPTTVSIIPVRSGNDESDESAAAKELSNELLFAGEAYTVGPSWLMSLVPMTVAFERCCRADGAGIYQLADGVWEYLPSAASDGAVAAMTTAAGTYRLAFDRTAPVVTLVTAGEGMVVFRVTDGGSGVDTGNVRAIWNGIELAVRFDPGDGLFHAVLPDFHEEAPVTVAVTAPDRSGNTREALLDARLTPAPGQFSVSQNMPNPFNPSTTIPFAITSEQRVTVVVYDALGRRVRELADDVFAAGSHRVIWDGRDDGGRVVSSGVYLYRVEAGRSAATKRMVLMR